MEATKIKLVKTKDVEYSDAVKAMLEEFLDEPLPAYVYQTEGLGFAEQQANEGKAGTIAAANTGKLAEKMVSANC